MTHREVDLAVRGIGGSRWRVAPGPGERPAPECRLEEPVVSRIISFRRRAARPHGVSLGGLRAEPGGIIAGPARKWRSRISAPNLLLQIGCGGKGICCNNYFPGSLYPFTNRNAQGPIDAPPEPSGILRLMSFTSDFRRLTPAQRHTFLAAFLGWTMDSLDFFLLIFCVKAIAGEFHTQPSAVLGAVFMTQAFRPVGSAAVRHAGRSLRAAAGADDQHPRLLGH